MFHFLTDFIDRDGIFANRKDIFIVNLYVLFLLRLMIFVIANSPNKHCNFFASFSNSIFHSSECSTNVTFLFDNPNTEVGTKVQG